MPPIIHTEQCTHCGMCATICPMNIFKHKKGEIPQVAYPEECWHCNACARPKPWNFAFPSTIWCCMSMRTPFTHRR